jgi:serine/threonine protein kinase, bacterial
MHHFGNKVLRRGRGFSAACRAYRPAQLRDRSIELITAGIRSEFPGGGVLSQSTHTDSGTFDTAIVCHPAPPFDVERSNPYDALLCHNRTERNVSQGMVTCVNGHENPQNHQFCGECGVALASSRVTCPHGHIAAKRQRFCGMCGAPVRGPIRSGSGGSDGRWSVDPSARHQYRYWDGTAWTEHVADNGTLSTSAPPKTESSTAERWIGVAAGVVTVVLLAGAASAITTQFSGGETARTTTTPAAVAAAPPAPPPAVAPAPGPPPDNASPWPVAVIGAACRPNSNNAVTADGSIAYCVNVRETDAYLWSLFPGDLGLPGGQDPAADPSIAVCAAQTQRTEADCVEYLMRPSDPGDGQPPVQ